MPLILDDTPSTSSRSSPTLEDQNHYRRTTHHEADALVIGAGILGTSLAVTLARQNRSVILLEKSLKEPDRIVGELLQPGGVAALKSLGLGECLEGIDAVPVRGYECFYYGEGVEIPYPENAGGDVNFKAGGEFEGKGKREGPQGRSFHHGRLIRKLREVAMTTENLTVVESTATELIRDGYSAQVLGVESSTRGEKDYYFAPLTIISDGHDSKFRQRISQSQRPPSTSILPKSLTSPTSALSSFLSNRLSRTPISKSKFWGFHLHHCPLPSPQYGHVILSQNAPVLLYQISSTTTRALVDIPNNTSTASVSAGGVKSHLQHVVLPTLPAQVQPSFSQALEEGKLKCMPNSWLPPTVQRIPGVVMLGDAMNMRHPLTGGGMTVAFNDVLLLRSLLSPTNVPDLGNTRLVAKQMQTFHWQRKNLTSVINILAQALYSLFAADDKYLRVLQQGCFRYFKKGGNCIDGPIGLLGGIIRNPMVLVYHFFSVAVLGMWIYVLEGPPSRQTLKIEAEEAIGGGGMNGYANGRVNGNINLHTNGHTYPNRNNDINKIPNGHAINSSPPPPTTHKKDEKQTQSQTKTKTRIKNPQYIPIRILMSLAVFWKAFVVIAPYIVSELRS